MIEERGLLPQPVTQVDIEAYDNITSVDSLLNSIHITGDRWGRRLANVKMSVLPRALLGMPLITEKGALNLVIARWDRHEYLGWEEEFPVTLTFPDTRNELEVMVPSSSKMEDGHSFVVDLPEEYKVSQKPPQTDRRIPRVFWNISQRIRDRDSHMVRRVMHNNRFINKFMQCSHLYVVLDDEDSRKEIASSTIPGLLEAYDAIIPGSFKADIARYQILYRYGGVYADDKSVIRYSLDSYEFDEIMGENCDIFVGLVGLGIDMPEIAFLACRPGCVIMRKALEQCVYNINRRFYGANPLDITGNLMIKQILEEGVATDAESISQGLVLKYPKYTEDRGSLITRTKSWGENLTLLRVEFTRDLITFGKDVLWHQLVVPREDWPPGKNRYCTSWKYKVVYVDGNQPLSIPEKISIVMGESIFVKILSGLLVFAFLGFVAYIIQTNPSIGWT